MFFLQDIKAQHAEEHDRLMKQIEEERMNLITEKAKLETNLRLQKGVDSSKSSRAEIEAAIKVAEEASRQADIERDRLIEVQKQYEQKRRQLSDKENSLRSMEIRMEDTIKSANEKEVRQLSNYHRSDSNQTFSSFRKRLTRQ